MLLILGMKMHYKILLLFILITIVCFIMLLFIFTLVLRVPFIIFYLLDYNRQ